ncbi:MAG: FkbM family methyltransferase [Nostoc sp.]|uniref:FkbM family methyltransferase n=1 Tax=Nostoc sp. TaxID=1180 RepID=UPI002FFA2926
MEDLLSQEIEILLSEDIDSVIKSQQGAFDELAAPFEKSIIIFGAGFAGIKALNGLRQLKIEPLAFADNNQRLWNQFIEGVPVLSPQEAAIKFGNTSVFVITVHNSSRPKQQLLDLNCKKVISYAYLFAKYPKVFLPYFALDLPYEIYKQSDDIQKAFSLFVDESSRREYLSQLRWRLFLDFDKLAYPITQSMRDEEYFPLDIYMSLLNEIFVDCGAFDGDTIRRFLTQREYLFDKIIGLEPDPFSFKKLQTYVSTIPENFRNKVTLLQAAVGARQEKLKFQAMSSLGSGVSNTGTVEVDCVALDDVLNDCVPTLIKMDLEGFELSALTGASQIIENASAVLAITIYHCQDHLWRIPLFIHSLSNDYHFFLKPHAEEFWDVSCYAVPVTRLNTKFK